MALLSILLERLVVLLGRAKIWPKQLACWLTLIYAILFGLTWAADGVFVNRWYILIANGALTLAALAGMLVKKPFTADFAKERAPEQMWGHPKFLQINMIITAAWVLAFAIVTASNAVVAAECTVDQVNSSCPAPKAINIIFSYILPFGSLIAAALFTQWFSERARARARAAMAAAGDAGLSTYNEYQVAEGPVAPKAEPV
ncbi:hypothetical protein WJX72_008123 [[Myrmecia] bisecta]|uniref:Uncharacterized protein n=1 Tax=[Myrmecia] bisecta TaxID=41462 RepID=A0AAW1R906_9CHLO